MKVMKYLSYKAKKKMVNTMSDKKVKRNIRIVFFVYFSILILLVMHITKFYLVDKFEIINTTLNPRVFIVKDDIIKGSILDKNNEVLAKSYEEGHGRIYLDYPQSLAFSHIVGFIIEGGLGLEANYSLTLQSLNNELIDRINNLISDKRLEGLNIKLTIDKEFQNFVYNEMKVVEKGAVVVIEPSTGKILAMVSMPSFNPNEIDYNVDDTRYLNRVVQGMYPPGSIFKVISALAIMRNVEDYENDFYECNGEISIDGATISCYNHNQHGKVNLSKAIEQSCNTYFAYQGNRLGIETLRETAENLGFNKVLNFDLTTKVSKITEDEVSTLKLMQTYIGQGDTLVTPLQMAVLYGGIANGGMAMSPYIVESVVDNEYNEVEKVTPKVINKEITSKEAEVINNMLVAVVEEGTAMSLNQLDYSIAGKTGSAEANSEVTHGWFAGYAPSDNPKIALCIIFEDSNGSKATMNTVKNIFEYYLKE